MKFLSTKKEEQIKKEVAKILVLSQSLLLWNETHFDGLTDYHKMCIEHDIKELNETVHNLFWKEL